MTDGQTVHRLASVSFRLAVLAMAFCVIGEEFTCRGLVCSAVVATPPSDPSSTEAAKDHDQAEDQSAWIELPLKQGDEAKQGWQPSGFGGDGPIQWREDGTASLGRGEPMTGIRYFGEFPKEGYELRWEGRRMKGFDFFCTATFPVGNQHCSLVLGGWTNSVVGLSNVDGEDASDNHTRQSISFDNERWYAFRIRVTASLIEAWIDDQATIEQQREGHQIDIRDDIGPTKPLGFASFMSVGEIRNVAWRSVEEGSP
jgi:hypothetical protein